MTDNKERLTFTAWHAHAPGTRVQIRDNTIETHGRTREYPCHMELDGVVVCGATEPVYPDDWIVHDVRIDDYAYARQRLCPECARRLQQWEEKERLSGWNIDRAAGAINAKLREVGCRDTSDEELARCLLKPSMFHRCYHIAILLRDAGLLDIDNDEAERD